MECAQCGALVPPGRRACPTCGAPAANPGGATAKSEVDALLTEAALLRSRGLHDEAIGVCTRVLRLDSSNAAVHSLLANIYRDQGNFREALGWFKLATELNPNSTEDKDKFNEMTGRVLQSSLYSERAAAASPSRRRPARAPFVLKDALAKIQPAYMVVGTTVLAMCLMLIVVLVINKKPQPQHEARQQVATPNSDPVDAATTATAVVMAPTPQVVPPPPDKVEGGDTRAGITGLPGITVAQPPPPKPANPVPDQPPNLTRTSDAAPPINQVAPFQPSTADNAIGTEDIEVRTTLLQHELERNLRNSPLPATLSSLNLDPRTDILTLEFTLARMPGPKETKQGLLYTAFHLVWSAADKDKRLTRFTLRGNAFATADGLPSLALITDITREQAATARTYNDYTAVLTCLTDPRWRRDLLNVAL